MKQPRFTFSKTPDLVAPSSPGEWAARQIAHLPRSSHGLDPQPLVSATAALAVAAEVFQSDLLAAYGSFMPLAPAAVVRAFAGAEYEWAGTLAGDMRRAARAEVIATALPGHETELRKVVRSYERDELAKVFRAFVENWGHAEAMDALRNREAIV